MVAIVQAADEPFNLFGASCRSFILRPLIGIITKIDSPYANIPMVRQWLINAGCERIFMVNNVTREGIDELMEYLQEDTPKLTLEQAKFKQSLGLNEWILFQREWLIRKKKRICYKKFPFRFSCYLDGNFYMVCCLCKLRY